MHPTVIVGAGRLGTALAAALRLAPPLRRGEPVPPDAGLVLLCVPDAAIAEAAAAFPPRDGLLVGHCSGATTLAPLAPHEALSLHPLLAVTARGAGATDFAGAAAAVAGTTPRALHAAHDLAARLGLRPIEVDEADRVAYHAAAALASNLLVTLEGAAERLAATAGVDRAALVPLVRATVDNWAMLGPRDALTGPVARGDAATVAAHRAVIADRVPDLLPTFDALTDATRALAAGAPA